MPSRAILALAVLAIYLSDGMADSRDILYANAPTIHAEEEKFISPREVIEKQEKLLRKTILIDGFFHEICEAEGCHGCIASRKHRRFTIFGGPVIPGRPDIEACRSGGTENLLLVPPLADTFAKPKFRRIRLTAKLIPHYETPPKRYRNNGISIVSEFEVALSEIHIISASDRGCEREA